MTTGFEGYPTATLITIERNLLDGLTVVAKHIDNGTFSTIAEGKSSPPSQSGQLTLILLLGVQAELRRRPPDV